MIAMYKKKVRSTNSFVPVSIPLGLVTMGDGSPTDQYKTAIDKNNQHPLH